MEQLPTARLPRWLKRLIQLWAAVVLADGALKLANLIQAHTCGLNRLELNDGGLLAVGILQLVAGIGSVLMKAWGRLAMLLYLFGRTAWAAFLFLLVLRVPNTKPDALGWILIGGIFTFLGSVILLYWRGWQRVLRDGVPGVSWKWLAVGGVFLVFGTASSWMESILSAEPVEARAGLDGRFLQTRKVWQMLRSQADGTPSVFGETTLQVSEEGGRIILREFPPRSRCRAEFDPVTGFLTIAGAPFAGQEFEAAPPLVGGRKLRGLRFRRPEGAIHGDVVFGLDQAGKLYVLINNSAVRGKDYEGVYFSSK